ncbi:toll/interleukin-1 receptor domain-containing protein [Pseudoalteromonas piscicida]|uniref:toll/interleukin-1 receptor domain-containing protein n=1 Tax=Pseudoalteromonas piscicida TaxID=43662 RepID=UPI0030C97A70
MPYYTKQQARNAARESVRKSHASNSRQALKASFESASSYQKFDVFLSHSSDDAELILGIKKILEEEQGLTVYVDWDTDRQLSRENVNKETADLLRMRMKQSKSLIYVATENSPNSRWMPWELGYFDGFRPQGVAILPLLDSEDESFNGQEYLSLYPVVTKGRYKNGQKETFVKNGFESWQTLKQFGGGATNWRSYS